MDPKLQIHVADKLTTSQLWREVLTKFEQSLKNKEQSN